MTIIERETHPDKSNPLWTLLHVIAWPFRKLGGLIVALIGTILHAMVRSVVSFVMGLLLLAGSGALLVVYGVSLTDSNFDVLAAFQLLLERVSVFVQGLF